MQRGILWLALLCLVRPARNFARSSHQQSLATPLERRWNAALQHACLLCLTWRTNGGSHMHTHVSTAPPLTQALH